MDYDLAKDMVTAATKLSGDRWQMLNTQGRYHEALAYLSTHYLANRAENIEFRVVAERMKALIDAGQ